MKSFSTENVFSQPSVSKRGLTLKVTGHCCFQGCSVDSAPCYSTMSFSIFLYFAHFNCKIAISPLQRSAPSSRHPPSSLLDISFHQLPQQKLLFIFPGYSHTSCFKLALFYLHLETFHLSVLEGADYLSYDSHMNTSIILIILELLK